MESAEVIASQLKDAIDQERTDVICSVISELQKGDGILLQQVLNEQQTEYGTLLHYTTKCDKPDIIRALLSGGADPGIQNKEGKLPLELGTSAIAAVYNEELLQATAQSNLGRVCQLLAAGVDVNLVDGDETKNSPLHWAVSYANRDMVQCLCARGANVNSYNSEGYTPLHEAVKRADSGIVEELLLQSVDTSLTVLKGVDKGKTALDLCGNNISLKQVLRSAPEQLVVPSTGLPMARGMHNNIGSKQNLVRFDSSASGENALGFSTENDVSSNHVAVGNNYEFGPELATPTFKKYNACFGDGSIPTLRPSIAEENLYLLWPQPQSIVEGGGNPFVAEKDLCVFISAGPNTTYSQIREVWNLRKPNFESLGFNLNINMLCTATSDKNHVLCHVNKRLCPVEGTYKITISPKQFKIIAGTIDSLRTAICTMLQLFDIYTKTEKTHIPTLLIDDWPELHYRGVLLDISQGRIPNFSSLLQLIDTLSLLKFNQIYLYSKFKNKNPQEWQAVFSSRHLTDIDEYCLVRGIHLYPVLEVGPKVQYEDLPEIFTSFQAYTSCFSQTEFLSVGPRLSSFILEATEDNLDVLDGFKYLPLDRQQTVQLCGYPLHDLSTNLLQQLPPHIAFQELGVKADHDFKRFCSSLSDLGINFFVCPGTAAWNSLGGCPEAALSNIFHAMKCATTQGSIGMVVCDWAGKGHFTHQAFSWPGLVLAAGLSWNSETPWDFLHRHVPDLINCHIYHDKEGVIGNCIIELGRAETYLLHCSRNKAGVNVENLPDEHGSILFRLLTNPDSVALENLTGDMMQRVNRHVKKCHAVLSTLTLPSADVLDVVQELQLSSDLMILATKVGRALILAGRNPGHQAGHNVVNFGIANLTPTSRTDLANRLLELLQIYICVWDKNYLPHVGKQDSLSSLHSFLKQLVPDKDPKDLFGNDTVHTSNNKQ